MPLARGTRRLHVLGPVDSSSWHGYRFSDPEIEDSALHFPGEPCQPDYYPEFFLAAGYEVVARYTTRVVTDPVRLSGLWSRSRARLLRHGYRVEWRSLGGPTVSPLESPTPPGTASSPGPRKLTAQDGSTVSGSGVSSLATRAHALALAAFAGRPAFSRISLEAFISLYVDRGHDAAPSESPKGSPAPAWTSIVGMLIDPEGRDAGLTLLLYPPRGDAVFLKTLGLHPRNQGIGLGSGFAAEVYDFILTRGCATSGGRANPRIVHCLMEDDGPAVRLDRGFGQPIRGYSLYGKEIGPARPAVT